MLEERERSAEGGLVDVLTVFLAGRECPFTCVFCDLWRHTLDGPTPLGALPRQLASALRDASPWFSAGSASHLKLYNASNFFDPLAVPPADYARLAELAAPFERLVVECHPRLVGRRCWEFAGLLETELEVALGLETAHPEALARLNKRIEIDDFDRAAAALVERGIGVRAFVLIGAPFVPEAERAEWIQRSVEHALAAGAGVVSLIPVRATESGSRELLRLAATGDFRPPLLGEVEDATDRAMAAARAAGRVVLVDLWEAETLAGGCEECVPARRGRLVRMNRSGAIEPRVRCARCGGDGE